jgi:hypothetical protein
MAELSVRMTGDEAELVSKLLTVIQKNREVKTEMEQTQVASAEAAKAVREAARQQAALANEGRRIAEGLQKQNESLAESYDRQAKVLHAAHTEGKIDAEQLKKALGQLETQFENQASANRQAAREASEVWQTQQREAREGIAIVQRLERSSESLESKYAKLKQSVKAAWADGRISSMQYAESLRSLDAEYDKIVADQNKVVASNNDAFGENATAKIAQMATGWVSVQSAVRFATEAVRQYNEERDKGKSETESLKDARRRLFQVSDDDFGQLEQRADNAAQMFGVDRALARNVLFAARSEGFEDDYEKIIAMTPVIDPQASGTVAGQVRKLFTSENLDAGEAVAGVLRGAKSSRLDFEGLTRALPQVGEGGRAQGAGFDESIAAVSVLASVFKTGETTGDRLKAFLSKLSLNEETKGLGLIGGYDALQNMSQEDRKKFLGESQELNAVYSALNEFAPAIREQTKEIADARSGGVSGLMDEYYKQPALVSLMKSDIENVKNNVLLENNFSGGRSDQLALRQFMDNQSIERGDSPFVRYAGNLFLDAYESINGNTGAAVGEANQNNFNKRHEELLEAQERVMKDIAENTKRPPLVARPGEDK